MYLLLVFFAFVCLSNATVVVSIVCEWIRGRLEMRPAASQNEWLWRSLAWETL